MMAAKRGRKRNGNANRYPSGQIKIDPRVLDNAEFVRMRDAVRRHSLHEAWVCELWRRAFFGQISNEMRVAGDQFLRLREEHLRVCEAPSDRPKVVALERGYGRQEIDLEAMNEEQQRQDMHYRETVRRRWDRACAELMDRKNGTNIMKATRTICLTNEPQTTSELELAKEGLLILARHFGLCKTKQGS